MALVRGLKDVYLGSNGYHKKDEEFEYSGPKNHNLEPLEKSKADAEDDEDNKYHQMSTDELKAELETRQIAFKPTAKDATYRKLLEADDDSK